MSEEFVLATVGVVLLVGLTLWLSKRRADQLRATGVWTRGEVISHRIHAGRTTVLRPVVRFETKTGKVIEAEDTNGVAYAIPRFSQGTMVRLVYEETNPHNFQIESQGNILA